jgi:hypothetical protein
MTELIEKIKVIKENYENEIIQKWKTSKKYRTNIDEKTNK